MTGDVRTAPDLLERAYLALFRLLPAAFRARFAAEMLEFFRARRAAARSRGRLAHLTFVASAAGDVIAAAWRERRNRLAGIVTRVVRDTVMAQVEIQAGPFRLVSLMSREAADELGLEIGVRAVATVKATQVSVDVP